MKAWKSTIAILLVLSLFCTLSVSVFAADSGDFSYTVLSESEKTCTLTAYNGTAKTLDIPETLDGYTVTALGQALFIYSRGPDTVTVPKTVTALDKTTFSFSKIMKSVTVAAENPVFSSMDGVLFNKAQTELLYFPVAKSASQYAVPNGVTVIGEKAFYGTAVPVITFPSTLKTIGTEGFSANEALREIVIPEGVTEIGAHAFRNCRALQTAVLPDSVTSLGVCTFYNCERLETVRWPQNLQTIPASTLFSCKALKAFSIPEGTTEIGTQAFYRCDALAEIDIPASVTAIGSNAFARGNSAVPLTVYGTEGSYAQTFAEEKGFAFAVRRTQTVLTLRNPQGTCIVKTDTLTESGESGEQYTVTIPAETVIPWGKSVQEISYSVESHLRYRRALTVTVSSSGTMVYAPTAEDSFTLPYTLADTDFHADRPTVYPAAVQTMTMQIADADWANAVVGEYADILTFTAAVV